MSSRSQTTAKVFERALAGDRRSLARAMTRIENRSAHVLEAIAALPVRRRSRPGRPHVIGVTGPPGAGKSTFVERLIAQARKADRRVGVIAVDPSSPFTGGAILGDRIRMDTHSTDPGVFIRSLSSRGHLGGLSRASGQIVDLLDAVGFDLVLLETVGVGQSELSVMEIADTVLVILTPESGDTVQTMKAGLLEVADLFVVNKADRPGADRLCRDLEQMVRLDTEQDGAFGRQGIQLTAARGASWCPPVHATCARADTGIDEVTAAATAHQQWLTTDGIEIWRARRAAGRVRTFIDLVAEDARARAIKALETELGSAHRGLLDGTLNPYELAAQWPAE